MSVKFLFVEQPTTINGKIALNHLWSPPGQGALGKITSNTLPPGMYAVSDAEGFAKLNPTIQLTDPKGGNPDPPGALAALGLTRQMVVAMGQGDEEDV